MKYVFDVIVSIYIIIIILLVALSLASCHNFDVCWIDNSRHIHFIDR